MYNAGHQRDSRLLHRTESTCVFGSPRVRTSRYFSAWSTWLIWPSARSGYQTARRRRWRGLREQNDFRISKLVLCISRGFEFVTVGVDFLAEIVEVMYASVNSTVACEQPLLGGSITS